MPGVSSYKPSAGPISSSWLNGNLVLYPGAGGNGVEYYVDATNGSDTNPGTSWAKPLATIQAALDLCVDGQGDRIYLLGNFDEAVAGTVGKDFVTIIGVGPSARMTRWKQSVAANTEPCIDVHGLGYRFVNIKFEAPTGSAAIKLNRSATSGDQASDAIVEGCEFNTGQYAIESAGGAAAVIVRDCIFHDMTSAAADAGAIISTSTAIAAPLRWTLERCKFINNKNHVILPGNDCIVKDCVFQAQGNSITTTDKLKLSGATGRNQVLGCYFEGTYSIGGGYTPGTNDAWYGCYGEGYVSGGGTVQTVINANPA